MPLSFRDSFSKRGQAGSALLNAVSQQRSATACRSFLFLEQMRSGNVLSAVASGNNLKVFRVNLGGVAGSSVMFRPQADKFTAQDLLPACVQRCKGARHGPVIDPEE